jgi:hypothetical protein
MKNILKFSFQSVLLIALVFVSGCSDFDDNLEKIAPVNTAEVITKDSELYHLIEKVTAEEGTNALEEIVCIDFVYPLQLLVYDENLQVIGTQIIIGDEQFSAFLGAFPAQQSLSISYPISTTLADGTVFSVNNNTELKLAIDSCSREDIITYCNNLFCNASGAELTPCVWKVKSIEGADNKYVSGTFMVNQDGSLVFDYNEIQYLGSWSFLFINDELHLNINLEGNSSVAQDWNFDRRVELVADMMIIQNTPKNIVLRQICASATAVYHIGDVGPSEGIVFCDKGSYSHGWRYMEVAMNDLGALEWGCSATSIANAQSAAIGKGLFNTAAIVNFHDNLNNYYLNPAICNGANNGTVAAKNAILHQFGSMNEWFLPSAEELNLVYTNLYLHGLGNFTAAQYWTSTEVDATTANTINFATGELLASPKIPPANTVKTRAVRYF